MKMIKNSEIVAKEEQLLPSSSCSSNLSSNKTTTSTTSSPTAQLRSRFHNLPIHKACYYHGHKLSPSILSMLFEFVPELQLKLYPTNPARPTNVISDHDQGQGSHEYYNQNSTLLQQDSKGMTILHIICCTPISTMEQCFHKKQMISMILQHQKLLSRRSVRTSSLIPMESSLHQQSRSMVLLLGMKDCHGRTPLEVFLNCHGIDVDMIHHDDDCCENSKERNVQNGETKISLYKVLLKVIEMGVPYPFIEIVLSLMPPPSCATQTRENDSNADCTRQEYAALELKDAQTGLYPFMIAATSLTCNLETIYLLLQRNVHLVTLR